MANITAADIAKLRAMTAAGLMDCKQTIENTKRGALKKEDYNVQKHINGLHVRFLPEQTTEENISSREFLKKAEFIIIDSLLPKEEEPASGSEEETPTPTPTPTPSTGGGENPTDGD